MLRKIASSAFRRLDLPVLQSREWMMARELRKKFEGIPRYVKGEVSINGWNLEYVDTLSFLSAFETVVLKKWNDFTFENDNPVILDCGANVGIATLHYKKLFPNAQITAFEPDHEVCEVMRSNLRRNNINDVKVVEAAVWKEVGELEFLSEGSDAGKLSDNKNELAALTGENPKASLYKVKTIRLADFLADSKIDFIKMDIEGAECDVINDCAGQLKAVQSMIIECHYMNDNPRQLATIINALSDNHFNLAINSYGQWTDLSNRHTIRQNVIGYDQYFLISAWRD